MQPCSGDCAGQALRPDLPEYLQHYPCFKKVQVAAVKKQIYNCDLPTLRAMDRDTLMHKLPDDHCQTTTCCTAKDFVEASLNPPTQPISYLNNPRIQPIRKRFCSDVTETGKPPNKFYNTSEDVQRGQAIWSRYMTTPNLFHERPEAILLHPDNFDKSLFHFDGTKVRKILPVKSDIRKCFTSEPHLDRRCRKQQQPTPFEITSRYRHTYPIFFRDMSSTLWRNPDIRPEHPNPPAGKLTRKE